MPEHDYESIMVRSLVAGIADFDKLDAVSLKRQLDSLRALTQSGMCQHSHRVQAVRWRPDISPETVATDDVTGQRCRRKAAAGISHICRILERFAVENTVFHSSTSMPDLLISALGCLRFVTKVCP
jgi:hypothetical protein